MKQGRKLTKRVIKLLKCEHAQTIQMYNKLPNSIHNVYFLLQKYITKMSAGLQHLMTDALNEKDR